MAIERRPDRCDDRPRPSLFVFSQMITTFIPLTAIHTRMRWN